MSLEIARQVNAQYPEYLQRNVGETCHWFTQKLVDRLRAEGHQAYLMCKTHGEGQYVPRLFQPREVVGLDGKTYRCTGVSHDAIWCDGKQFDTIAGANEYDRPIYRKSSEPFWSFDAAEGPQIRGGPIWNDIDPQHWRVNNPPLKGEPVVVNPPPPPPPPPPSKILSKGEAFMRLKALNAFYQAPEGLQRPGGMVLPDEHGRSVADMEAIAQWFYQMVIDGVSLENVFTQIRASDEWRSKHP
jgi:hypothetical protein